MESKHLIVMLLLGVFLWIFNAAFDMLTFPNLSFLNALIFKVPFDQLIFRTITLVVFASVGVFLSRTPRYAESAVVEELRRSKEMYETLLNNLPVGVYRITGYGEIVWANRQFTQMLGCKKEKLQNINLNEICVNGSDRQTQLEKLREAPVFAEFEIRPKDGGTVWVQDYPKATLNETGKIAYIDGVCMETHGIDALIRDITERKRLQNMKDQFFTAVTHELRTPLVSIKGYVDHIVAKESNLTPSLRSQIEIVKRNTQRLLNLTEDLLNIQYMETGRLQLKFEDLNLQEILTQCVEEIQPLVNEKGQEVRLEIPGKTLLVVADRVRLVEVLMNLLQNANKFSPNGGSITLRVEEDVGTVTISVTDGGIGIDKRDLGRVFEPFAAIPKPTYFKSSGLGLSLTKRLVETHGGKIWVTSAGIGSGATFAFTIPKLKEESVRAYG
jgi:two-component system phosphate regulon sensor histidine kinase PhoR